MRVTKVIKEYIERKVDEAYPLPIKKDAIHEEFEKLRQEVGTIYRDKALEFIEKYKGKVGLGFGASLNQTLEEAKRYLTNISMYQSVVSLQRKISFIKKNLKK